MIERIAPSEVEIGMYVVGFGGGWFDHPFWRRRFMVEKASKLERIRRCGLPYVEIDCERGKKPGALADRPSTSGSEGASGRTASSPLRGLYRPPIDQALIAPADMGSPAFRRTGAAVAKSADAMRQVFEQLGSGWRVDSRTIEGVFEDIEREIERDADTLLKVLSLKTKDNYTYMHSIAVCAMMVCVARHRGMEPDEVRKLGLAGLLHDLGKVSIADSILKKPGRLTDEEFKSVQSHPAKGFELLKDLPDVPEAALDVCLHHHEKMDGSGYPFGHAGEEISIAARLGAVCDVLDALTSKRPYKKPWSRQKAFTAMWSWDGHFDKAVLAELMQVLHCYPAGLLVRLSNGNLAKTMEVSPLKDVIKVTEFFDAEHRTWMRPRTLQITHDDSHCSVVSVEELPDWGFASWQEIDARLHITAVEQNLPEDAAV